MTGRTPDLWVRLLAPNAGANVRLLCIAYAGGNAASFQHWTRAFPDAELYGVQLPGRRDRIRESPAIGLSEVADVLSDAVAKIVTGPLAVFGYSLGAIISFEMCRAMRRRGYRLPQHLFVGARRPPDAPDSDRLFHTENDATFITRVKELGGMPEEYFDHPELIDLLLPTLKADFRLSETYQYADEPPLPCDLTAFGGVDDPWVLPDQLEGWRRHASGAFRKHILPGGHFFIQSTEEALTRIIRAELHSVATRR